jgi:WD40 repeat protein/DNA-binding SARP family transcriptional activator
VVTALRITGRDEALGRRERIVLATLAVQRPDLATHDQLANALWPEGAPPTSAKVVQGCVSRLRGLLGADAITTLDNGYRVESAVVTDADSFTQRVARGRELLQLGQSDRAAYALDEALREWGGDPYVEIAHWGPAEAASARLMEEKALAEELHVDALLAAGDVTRALPIAGTLVGQAPFREHRWAQLALANYRAGNQAEALEVLRTCRATLRDELGIDPGDEITRLEEGVLRQELDPNGPTRADVADAECPWPGLAAYGPDDAHFFFGRDAELAAALAVLARRGVLAVVGPSGVGKSSFVGAGVVATLRARGRTVELLVPAAKLVLPACEVLVIDQGEEVFELGPAERDDLLRRLKAHPGQIVLAMRSDRIADVGSYPVLARIMEQGLFILGGLSAEGLATAIEQPAVQRGLLVEPGLIDLILRDLEGSPVALPLFSHALAQTWSRREGRTLTVAGYRASGGVGGALAHTAEAVHAALPEARQPALRSLMLRLVVVGDDGEPRRARVPQGDLSETHMSVLDPLVRARLVSLDDIGATVTHEALIDGWPRLRDWLDEDVDGRRVFQHLNTSARAWDDLGRPASELYRGVRLAGAAAWSERADVELAPIERVFLDTSSAHADAEAAQLARQVRRQTRANRILRAAAGTIAAALAVAIVLGILAVRQGRRADQKADEAQDATLAQTAVAVGAAALDTDDPQLALLLAAAAQKLSPSSGTAFNLAAAVAGRPELIRTVTVSSASSVDAMAVAGDRVVTADRRHMARTFTANLVPDASYQAGDRHLDSNEVPIAATPQVVAMAAAPEDPLAIRLLDAATLTELPQQLAGVPTGVKVQDLAVSHDGRYLGASLAHLVINSETDGSVDRAVVMVWDLTSRQPVRVIESPLSFTRVALSDDGATIFTSNPVSAYDVATGRRLWQRNEAWTGDVDARGRVVAAFTEDGTAVELLNSDSGLVRTTLTGLTGALQDVSFSPDGSTLAATSADGLALVWDTGTGRTLHRFDTGAGAATGVSYSPDATTLYVGKPLTREVQAWDLSGDRRFLSKIGFAQLPPYGTGTVVLGQGATRIARGGWRPDPAEPSLGLFDTRTGVEVQPDLVSETWSVRGAWSADEREFVTGYAGGWVQQIDGVSGRETGRRKALPADIVDTSYAGDEHVVAADNEGDIALLGTRPLALTGKVVTLPEKPYVLAGSPDGHTALVLTAGTEWRPDWGIEVRRWYRVDLADGTIVAHGDLTVRNGIVVALSPDGLSAAVGGRDGQLEVIDLGTGRDVHPAVSGVRGDIASVAFSPDGSRVLTTSTGPDVAVWDARTGALRSRFPLPAGLQVTSAQQSADGVVTVAALSGDTYEWDPSPNAAIDYACAVAGRDLTEQEWRDAFGDLAYRSTC